MELYGEYGENVHIRMGRDPSRYGKYEVELEGEVAGYLDRVRAALESSGYILVDLDQWGLSYSSGDDPDLSVDADELDDYGYKFRIILRKGKLSEDDIDNAREHLRQIYREITDKSNAQMASADV
jgi:hypothetical protein